MTSAPLAPLGDTIPPMPSASHEQGVAGSGNSYQGSKRATFSWPGPAWPKAARVFAKPAEPDSTLVQPGDFQGPPGPARPGPEDIFIYKDFFPVELGDQFGITINILGNN